MPVKGRVRPACCWVAVRRLLAPAGCCCCSRLRVVEARVLPHTLARPPQETFAHYRSSGGYGSEGKLVAALEQWGPNKFIVSHWRLCIRCVVDWQASLIGVLRRQLQPPAGPTMQAGRPSGRCPRSPPPCCCAGAHALVQGAAAGAAAGALLLLPGLLRGPVGARRLLVRPGAGCARCSGPPFQRKPPLVCMPTYVQPPSKLNLLPLVCNHTSPPLLSAGTTPSSPSSCSSPLSAPWWASARRTCRTFAPCRRPRRCEGGGEAAKSSGRGRAAARPVGRRPGSHARPPTAPLVALAHSL